MKLPIFLIVTVIIYFNAYAQQKGPNISFEDESHNFGKINEVKGSVTYTYNFRNTGDEPLIIKSVQPSCGCTTPEWSREPVVPGGKGYIKATFNPAGRPGSFNKSIAVITNGITESVVIRFSGEVIGKELTTIDIYPFAIGDLRLTSTYISFGKVSPERLASRNIDVINTGTSSVSLSFPSIPSHMEVMVNPSTIKPNQKATIEFSYDPKKKNDWGFVSDQISFMLNGKTDGSYKFNVSTHIEDNYTNANPQQLANAPKMIIENKTFDFGRIKAGTSIEIAYRFKNAGKTNLEIHKILPSCGCTNIKTKEKTVKPGSTGEIIGVFNSAGQKGVVNKTITVITNDPQNLNLVFWVRGTVE